MLSDFFNGFIGSCVVSYGLVLHCMGLPSRFLVGRGLKLQENNIMDGDRTIFHQSIENERSMKKLSMKL